MLSPLVVSWPQILDHKMKNLLISHLVGIRRHLMPPCYFLYHSVHELWVIVHLYLWNLCWNWYLSMVLRMKLLLPLYLNFQWLGFLGWRSWKQSILFCFVFVIQFLNFYLIYADNTLKLELTFEYSHLRPSYWQSH